MFHLPKKVLDLFPLWEYRCPACGIYVEPTVSCCPKCGKRFNNLEWRVPPRFLKSYEAMSEYAHKVLAPKLSEKERQLLFKYFTTIFSDGFESGDFSAWTGTVVSSGATLEVSTVQKHHGNYSSHSKTLYGSSDSYPYKTFTAPVTTYLRFYVYAVSITLASNSYCCLSSLTDAYYMGVGAGVYNYVGSLRVVLFWRDAAGMHVTISATEFPPTGEWHCFEVMRTRDAVNGELRIWLDGNELTDLHQTGKDTTNLTIDRVRGGHWYNYYVSGNSVETYVDCVVVADTYIGPEVVAKAPLKWTPHSL